MSYGTGSVGLNLQFTNYVFLFERWWNPAIEDQAINRAHRHWAEGDGFRQTLPSAKNSIEGRIAEVLEKKRGALPGDDWPKRPAAFAGVERGRDFRTVQCQVAPRNATRAEPVARSRFAHYPCTL